MRSLLSLALAFALAVPTLANDVDLRVDQRAELGKKPKLTLIINKDLKSATVAIEGNNGGVRLKQQKGPQAAGGEVSFELPHAKPGVVTWKGSLEVTFDDGATASMPLTFQTQVLSANFTFGFGKDDLDLEGDTLTLTSERATAKVEIEVYTDEDELLVSSAQNYEPAVPAGQPVRVSWIPRKRADALRIHLVVHDDQGAFRSSDSFPYSITIPHEDVVFDTGKAVIRPDQEPKLQAAVPEIERATRRFGPAMKAAGASVKLFISGHTDTVGNAAGNQALSQARATAIAAWFEKRGVPVAVYARGFGESVLKVETPDETDNEQNRRVEYDVGVNGPTGSLSGWAKVK
jgi:outer membrane protein OmpA-like peptidoglycan-associated protein